MRCRLIAGLLAQLALLPTLCSAVPAQNALDVDDLVRRAVANHVQREVVRNDYTYMAYMEWTDFAYCGRSRPQCSETYEIMFLEGAPYARHITHDGHPLSPVEEKMEEALLQAEARARRAGSGNPAGALLGDVMEMKSTWTVEHLVGEFNLRGKGTSVLNGRRVCVVEALPREKPTHLVPAQDYPRYFKTTLWIDIAEQQIIRVKEELMENGFVVIRPALSSYPVPGDPHSSERWKSRTTYARGAVFDIQWTKVNGEVWLPQKAHSNCKSKTVFENPTGELSRGQDFRREIETSYSDYQKFRVKTRIVP